MSDLLSIGQTGLFASKKSLEVTGHNLANANTEGYTRQRIKQTTNIPITQSGLIKGTGSRVVGVNRIHDEHLEKRLNTKLSESKYFKEREVQLEQVENIFNEIDGDGLHKVMNKFFNSFRELSTQPENETIRSVVRDNAGLVVKDFNRIRTTLNKLSRNIDSAMTASVTEINQITSKIAGLNRQIAELEAINDEASDFRDQRDLALRQLSENFKIHSFTDDKNNFIVSAKGLGTLVSGVHVQELATSSRSKEESSNNMANSTEVYFKGRPGFPVTKHLQSGAFSSLIKVRNEDVKGMQEKIDEIAFEFANTVNAIHKKGYVNREVKIDENGVPEQVDEKGPTTGINFFKVPVSREDAALNLDLSDAVRENLSNISTALSPNRPGDNRVAIAISKIQHEKILDGGNATLEEDYLKMVGNIGLETGKARLDQEQAEGILTQTQAIRERISGVSIDEETANLVKFQHAYDASAKVLKTADEMFRTVLSIMS